MRTFLALLLMLFAPLMPAAQADELANLVDLAGVRLQVRGQGGGIYSGAGYVGGSGDPETELTGLTPAENAHLTEAVRSDAETALETRGVPLLGARQPFTPPETRPVLEVTLRSFPAEGGTFGLEVEVQVLEAARPISHPLRIIWYPTWHRVSRGSVSRQDLAATLRQRALGYVNEFAKAYAGVHTP